MRVTKDPEVRQQELIAAAKHLFLTQGYENTSIDDIVRQLNVAKGLFYYYFPKKETILAAIADEFVEEVNFELSTILKSEVQDFKGIIWRILTFYLNTIRTNEKLLNIGSSNGTVVSLYVKQKLEEKIIVEFTELLAVFSGQIKLQYPAYTIKILVRGLGDLYLEGVTDVFVMLTLIEEILGLRTGELTNGYLANDGSDPNQCLI